MIPHKSSRTSFLGQKNAVFLNLGQNQQPRAFLSLKNSEFSESGVRWWKTAFFGTYGGHFGTFWPLFGQFWLKGPIQNNFFYWISCKPLKLGVKVRFKFFSFFDLFLAIFGKNPVSADLGQNQHPRAFFSLKKSEWSYSGVRSWKMAYFRPYEGHFGTFWQLFGHIWLKGPIQNNFFYWISCGAAKLGVKPNF